MSEARAIECLATAIYYEAATEPLDGQRAVAQVVLNRVRHPAFEPTVCGVVYQGSTRVTGCQFSFTCDGSLRRRPDPSRWRQAREIASKALGGDVFEPVGYATHYHADYVIPYWATSLAKNAVVGRHIFYRWPEWWGTPGAFSRRHAGREPDPHMLRDQALRLPHVSQASLAAAKLVIEADPRVELMSIIEYLATGSHLAERRSAYEEQVRLHFSPHANHLAVLLYSQLFQGPRSLGPDALLQAVIQASQPSSARSPDAGGKEFAKAGSAAKLQGFIAALRDFAKHSDFDKFYGEHKSHYARVGADARKPALALLRKLEPDADIPVYSARIVVAPLLADRAEGICQAVSPADVRAWLIVGTGDKRPFNDPKPIREAFAKLSRSDCAKHLATMEFASR